MASYVAFEPPGAAGGEVPDGTVFVRDGFTVLAFLVPLLWFLWHRMWIEAGLMLAVMLVLAGLDTMSSLPFLAGFASLLVSFALGLEAPALRMAALRRRGWHAWGVVEASNRREAEWRYAAEAEPDAAARAGMQSPPPQPPPVYGPAATSAPALGLFDYPGRR